MTIKHLLIEGIIQDNEKIKILNGPVIQVGHWYNDNILEYLESEITEYSWSKEKGWAFELK